MPSRQQSTPFSKSVQESQPFVCRLSLGLWELLYLTASYSRFVFGAHMIMMPLYLPSPEIV